MRIIFSGGGTGGHIYPALAIREILMKKYQFKSGYIGVSGGMEEKLVTRIKDIDFMGIKAQGMPRSLSLKWLSFPFINLIGIADAWRHLKNFKPSLVITTGGFVSFPTLFAAKCLNIPIVIHEQNAAMGVTNRLFAQYATKVLLTYDSAAKIDGNKYLLTGNPVRSSFLEEKKENSTFSKNGGEFVILAVGGSRGALSINKLCIALANDFLPKNPTIKLIHISGERDYKLVDEKIPKKPINYKLLPYYHEMKEAFDAADLLISRAGATTLSEIAVCKKPVILVPYPYATDNHQEKNAKTLEKLGAAKVLLDKDLNLNNFVELMGQIRKPEILESMSKAMEKSRPLDVESRILKEIGELLQ